MHHKATNPIRISFWQFEAQLEEFLTRSSLWAHRAEVFALYSYGFTVQQVATEIRNLELQPELP